MDVDVAERDHAVSEMEPHHDHPGDPEENYIEPGDQNTGRIVMRKLGCFFWPAKSRKRPQRGREPCIEHVGVAFQLDGFAVMLIGYGLGFFFRHLHENFSVGSVPGRDLMPPPDLTRNAPRLNVPHPFEIGVFPVFGYEPDVAFFNRLYGRFRKRLGIHEPLIRETGFDYDTGSVAVRDCHGVVFDLLEQSEGVHFFDDPFPCVFSSQAPQVFWHLLIQLCVDIEDADHWKFVTLADLKIVEVVRRRNFHCSRSFFGIGIFVGNDRYRTADDWQDQILPDQIGVAVVFRMNGDGGIPQHRLWPGGGDGDETAVVSLDGIFEIPEVSV